MAYVESFYLDANLEQETHVQPVEEAGNIVEQAGNVEDYVPQDEFEAMVLADHPLNFDAISRIVEMQEKVERAKRVEIQVYSDYCGFENADLPPIYREQLRETQKKREQQQKQEPISMMTMKTAINSQEEKVDIDNENPNEYVMLSSVVDNKKYFAPPSKPGASAPKSGGSKYAWDEASKEKSHIHTNLYTKDYDTIDCVSLHDYVPGFSPPTQNAIIHKRMDFALPNRNVVNATENVYHRTNESRWIERPSPIFKRATSQPVSHTGTLATSSMVSSSIESSSAHTATQGPPYGALGFVHDKYKGMGAFKPVSEAVESQYAYPGLN